MREVLTCLILVLLCSVAAAQERLHMIENFDGAEMPDHVTLPAQDAYGPVDTQASWAVEEGRLVGRSPRWPWSQILMGSPRWRDVAAGVDLTVLRPTGTGPGWGGETYKRYWNDENLRGFDAALIVRCESPESMYRVQVATRTGEVALWKPSAGVVNVGRLALEPGRTCRIAVQVAGSRIRVYADGELVMDYLDPRPGPKAGRIGLGVCNSDVAFDNLTVAPLGKELVRAWPRYPESPDFSYGPWQNGFAMFDRGEPVCWVDTKQRLLHRVKLRRGGAPLFLDFASWKAVPRTAEFRDQPMQVDVERDGPELLLKFSSRYSPNADSFRKLHLTYEADTGRYIYDWETVLSFEDPTNLTPGYWRAEFIDPIWYNAWGPPGQVQRPWRCEYTTGLISGPKGAVYRRPLNHDSNRTRDTITHLPSPWSWSGMFPSADLSPVVEIEDVDSRGIYTEMCHAFYDFHYIFTGTQGAKEAAPAYRVKFRYIGYPPEKSKKLLASAVLHPGFDNSRPEVRNTNYRNALSLHGAFNLEYPFCTTPVNRFSNLVSIADTYSGRGWYGDYAVDKTQGYDDSFSIRFDGPRAAYGFFGQDHGFDRLEGGRLAVEFMLKTRGVTGDGLHVAVGNGWQHWQWEQHLVTNLKGDNDWQAVRFVFEPGGRCYSITVVLKMNGNGTAWVDNFAIRKAADDEVSELPPAARVVEAPYGQVMDLRCDEGSGPGTTDRSGWGNGGLLVGPQWVRDEERWVLRFDGVDDYINVPHANSLNPLDRVTLEAWVKPDADTGHSTQIMAKYFDLLLALYGHETPYQAVGTFRAAARGRVEGRRDIEAGRWHHLAQTYDGQRVRLYVDGKPVAEAELSGNLAASLNPLFIGTYLPHEGNAWYKGLLGGVRMHWRALGAEEIARIAAQGLPK